jgi:hypothetical protein
MRKNLFVSLFLFALLSTHTFAQNPISREEAYNIIKQKGLVDTLNNNVQVSKQIIPPNTEIKLWQTSIKSPASDSWVFLVDLNVFAAWTHPCKYVFVNTLDASLKILDSESPPDIELDYLLFQKEPDNLPHINFGKKNIYK